MKSITLSLVGIILLMAGTGIALAQAPAGGDVSAVPGQPQLPHSFFGTIITAGGPVPAGVPIEVQAEGVTTGIPGNPIYSLAGGYGSADPLTPRLEVQGTLTPGTPLTFYVGGIQADVKQAGSSREWENTYPFSPGAVTELNLRVTAVVTPDTAYHETAVPSLSPTPLVTLSAGGVNPSTDMMIGLIAILVILAIIAFYFGRRAERSKDAAKNEKTAEIKENRKE